MLWSELTGFGMPNADGPVQDDRAYCKLVRARGSGDHKLRERKRFPFFLVNAPLRTIIQAERATFLRFETRLLY